jgi:hypothetical protein
LPPTRTSVMYRRTTALFCSIDISEGSYVGYRASMDRPRDSPDARRGGLVIDRWISSPSGHSVETRPAVVWVT